MKKLYLLILLFVPLLLFSQSPVANGVVIKSNSYHKSASGQLIVSILFSVQRAAKVHQDQVLTLTPFIESSDKIENKMLQPIYLYGRVRQIIHQREHKIDDSAYKILLRNNHRIQTIDYLVDVPFESWMLGSNVKVLITCGDGAYKQSVQDKNVGVVSFK